MMTGSPLTPISILVDPVRTWDPSTDRAGGEFTYIDISAVDRESKQIVGSSVLPCREAPSRARQLVKVGDVLVSTVRPNLNAVALVCSELDGATASTGFTVLRPRPEALDSRYLFQWIRSPLFVEEMVKRATGASYPAVSDSIVKDSRIPLPPLPEQRRIADILDKADAVRRKRQEAIRLTDEFLRSAFLEMFGDPVTNPKGWPVVEFGSVTTSILGKMLSKASLKGLNPKPYLGNSHVRWRSFELSTLPEMDFTVREEAKLALRHGDLLVCEGGEVGRCATWREQRQAIYFQKALHRVRCDTSKVLPEYLQEYLALMAERGGLSSSTSTATIAHLTGVRLKVLPLPLPSIESQKHFLSVYSLHARLRREVGQSVDLKDSLFNSLVQRAFRGEL